MAKTLSRLKALKRLCAPKSPKLKTRRAAAKRYRVLPSGKVKVPHSGKAHNTGLKSRSRKNRLRKNKMARPEAMLLIRRCLPNSF